MTVQENKDISRRVFNVLNSGNFEPLNDLLADDWVYRSTAGEEFHGVEGAKEIVSQYREAFSDAEFDLQEMYAEGNKVVALYRQRGTHTGEIMGIEPQNKEMDILICSIGTFEDGRLVETFEIFDTLELLQQLGAVPSELEGWAAGTSGTRSTT